MEKLSLLSDRGKELLRKAANAFADGSDPFSTWWLVENTVNIEECVALSNQIAALIHWFLEQPADIQAGVLLQELGTLSKIIAIEIKEENLLRASKG